VGGVITGTMEEDPNKHGSWTISSSFNEQKPVTLNVKNVDPQSMATVTLEAYGIDYCTDYPPNGSTMFSGITLEDMSKKVTPTWKSNVYYTNCNEAVIQHGDSVILKY
jgi:hypothetical protein